MYSRSPESSFSQSNAIFSSPLSTRHPNVCCLNNDFIDSMADKRRSAMWMITPLGFFSAVCKDGGDDVCIRARSRHDLDRLRHQVLPSLTRSQLGGGSDYPARAYCPRQAWAQALARMAEAIDYPNFKQQVHKECGPQRAHIYGAVWQSLLLIEQEPGATGWCIPAPPQGAKRVSYGGVVVSATGDLVLLREVSNHYDGYVWTFAKGRCHSCENPTTTALREAEEEMGVRCRITSSLPQWYQGGTGASWMFLMHPEEDLGCTNAETAQCKWLSWQAAADHLCATGNLVGRKRDLRILDDARKLCAETSHE
ncbi:MAG: NUDIX domain-containing protein [Planctomycetota bacterium]|nr:MAG: NUDIX domain-containing protein [Planctomycetota bacterium]